MLELRLDSEALPDILSTEGRIPSSANTIFAQKRVNITYLRGKSLMYLLYTILKYLVGLNVVVKRHKKSKVEAKFYAYQAKIDEGMQIEESDTQEKARKSFIVGSNVGLRDVYYRKYVEYLDNLRNSILLKEKVLNCKGRMIPYFAGAIDLYLVNLLMQFEKLDLVGFLTTTYGYLK